MSKPRGQPKQKFEHSRYRDWRPTHMEQDKPRRRRGRVLPERRRGRVLGFLFRLVLWVALFLAVVGPGIDYANGLAKAPAGGCAVRMVVDGGRLLTGCPGPGSEEVVRIAGYAAPRLFPPACVSAIGPALLASLELRRALLEADTVTLRPAAAAPVSPAPEPPAEPEAGAQPDGEAPSTEAATAASTESETASETEGLSEAAPVSPGPAFGTVSVRVDGADLADVMLATGTVQLPGEGAWCR